MTENDATALIKQIKQLKIFDEDNHSIKYNTSKSIRDIKITLPFNDAFVKTATKSVLDWGPVLFILAHFSHDVSHKREKAIAFQDNYNQIKGEQAVIRAALDVHDELAASVDAE